jgi:large subunit ribosomal protein L25
MAEYGLVAQPRTITGKKVRTLRKQGLVPATIYGPNVDPVSIQFVYREVEVALLHAGGTHIIDIEVDGRIYPVLARDVQRSALLRQIQHVDFMAIDMSSTIQVDVPISIEGESPAVASRAGILITGPSVLTIEVMPSEILNSIVIDISALKSVGDEIMVRDLDLGAKVRIVNDPDEMLARVHHVAVASAEEQAEEDAMESEAQPELIARHQEEEID